MKNLVLLLLLLLNISVFSQSQIQHVEPLNWWVGMKNQSLQLMIHGENIAQYSPKINYKGVQIIKVNKVKNPNYLFLDLFISGKAKAGEINFSFSKVNVPAIYFNYQLLNRKENASNKAGFDASDAMYLITPDRFANANTTNDNVINLKDSLNRQEINGRHGGDIEGIIEHLDYIEKLGFSALWITPMLENNQLKTSYHGYGITNFSKIDPRFGTNEDYLRLSSEAKKHKIKLIADIVLNHCGSEHWWMKDLPTNDWVNFQNSPTTIYTNHRRESLHDPYAAEADKEIQSNGWFDSTMPDLNQKNEFMAKYLIQNSIWWVEYADLQGIRVDTWPYSDVIFLQNWAKRINQEYPFLNIVGEEWSLNPSIVAAWQKGKINANGYQSHLKSLFDFPLNAALSSALNEDETKWDQGFTKLYQTLSNDFLYPKPDNLTVFSDNHDMSRFYTQVKEDINLYKNGMAFLLTVRGIPEIYYGTEILMTNPKSEAHGEIRSDMPGGWQGDSKNTFTDVGLNSKEIEAKAFITKLLNWRKNTTAIHTGKLKHFAPKEGVYVLFRYNENQKIMVILNKNKTPYQLELSRFKEIINPNFSAKDIINQKTLTIKNTISLEPNTPLILEILE